MSKNKFIIGTLIGAAAGVVAGILTAPKTGRETRADVMKRAAALKKEAERHEAGSTPTPKKTKRVK